VHASDADHPILPEQPRVREVFFLQGTCHSIAAQAHASNHAAANPREQPGIQAYGMPETRLHAAACPRPMQVYASTRRMLACIPDRPSRFQMNKWTPNALDELRLTRKGGCSQPKPQQNPGRNPAQSAHESPCLRNQKCYLTLVSPAPVLTSSSSSVLHCICPASPPHIALALESAPRRESQHDTHEFPSAHHRHSPSRTTGAITSHWLTDLYKCIYVGLCFCTDPGTRWSGWFPTEYHFAPRVGSAHKPELHLTQSRTEYQWF
jgi:hypothetical protein